MEGMQEIPGKRMVEIQVIVLSPEGKVRLKRQEKKKRESVNNDAHNHASSSIVLIKQERIHI